MTTKEILTKLQEIGKKYYGSDYDGCGVEVYTNCDAEVNIIETYALRIESSWGVVSTCNHKDIDDAFFLLDEKLSSNRKSCVK